MMGIALRKEWRFDGAAKCTVPVVAYYKTGALHKAVCANPWPPRPTRRNKYVMYNCNRYKAVWLPDQEQ